MCTVGLMLNGCTIEDTMPGSPSFLGGQIKGGDVVEIVDGKAVSLETLVDLIRGSDRPGSKMEMQLRGPDRTLKTVHMLRQPRTQVLERRDLFLMLDEMRSMASTHVMEQRGKKKPDEPLIRFLNKTIEDLTSTIRQVSPSFLFSPAARSHARRPRSLSVGPLMISLIWCTRRMANACRWQSSKTLRRLRSGSCATLSTGCMQ